MKQTEIGMIPDDWEVKRLGEICKITSGESPSRFCFSSSGTPYFKVEQMNNCLKYQKETPYYILGNKKVEKRTIIFPKRGAAIETNKIRILYNDSFFDTNIMGLTIDKSVNNEYFYYWLVRKELWKIADTTSVPQINNKHINPLLLPLPPTLAEQQKIAKALSDVDNVITTLEKLITKKKNLKQGTMQQFLTGKKRLQGFVKSNKFKQTEIGEIPADWEVKTFGECCVKITDGSHFSPIEIENGFYMPSVKDMTATGFSFSDCKTISYNDYKKLVKMGCQPEIGDVLIAKDGSILKYAFSVKEKQDIVILSSIAILKPKSELLDPDFLAHYVSYPKFIEYAINNFKTGTGVPRIVLKGFAKLVILLPSKPEQTAIANVLSSMDKEIEALNTKLEKYRNLKTGMMQQLLTGKIRLV